MLILTNIANQDANIAPFLVLKRIDRTKNNIAYFKLSNLIIFLC